jgi:hypothetical protein
MRAGSCTSRQHAAAPTQCRGRLRQPRPTPTAPRQPLAPATPHPIHTDALKFNGPAPEIINGRLAMVGILLLAGGEAETGRTALDLLQHAAPLQYAGAALWVYASMVPILKGARHEAFGGCPCEGTPAGRWARTAGVRGRALGLPRMLMAGACSHRRRQRRGWRMLPASRVLTPLPPPAPATGMFTPQAEFTNGRAAMLAWGIVLLLEHKAGVPFF